MNLLELWLFEKSQEVGSRFHQKFNDVAGFPVKV